MKKFIIALVIIVLVALGIYYVTKSPSNNFDLTANPTPPTENATSTAPVATTTTQTEAGETVIGQSVAGHDLIAYHFGQGEKEILFIGGIHGGYEWNTALLAYKLMDYLKQNPDDIPSNEKVTVIPVLNPDGLEKVVGTVSNDFTAADVSSSVETQVAGRFNAHQVDLNRNFDCDWQTTGTWQNKSVSGGSKVFSEPESQALKSYIETSQPAAVIAWYSAAGGVYASSCHNGVSDATEAITKAYALASGYPAYDKFDFYETTGDIMNWLAKNNIAATSVLLTNHTDIEWSKNQAGVKAILKLYSK